MWQSFVCKMTVTAAVAVHALASLSNAVQISICRCITSGSQEQVHLLSLFLEFSQQYFAGVNTTLARSKIWLLV